MSAEAVLAIDQGTSGTTAVVVDPADGVLATAKVALHPSYLADGGVEQDPQALLDSVLTAGREALEQAGIPVGVLAIANQGETVLAWDPDDGRPLSPAIVWQDRRANGICQELEEHRGVLASRTGLVLDPYFSAPKMAWLRRNVTTAGVVSTTDAWLVHHLAGEFATDVSTASRSLVMDLDAVEWDQGLLELFGLGDEPLPRIVGCDERIGTTSAFGPAIDVGGLVVDQQAALLAQGCWDPGQAKCTFGTGAFLLANTGARAVRSVSGLTSSVAWRIRESTAYCIDGQIYTAASAVRWLTDLGLITHPSDLDVLGRDDAGGVVCVPALAGLAAPWWRPDATATFAGMTLATRAEHLVTAVLQGVAAQVAELTDVVERDTAQPLSTAQGRRRPDPIARPDASGRGPHPTSCRALPVRRGDRARRSRPRTAGHRPHLALDQAVLDWNPRTIYEPQWSPDRAAEFRDRWRRVAADTLPTGEP